MKEFNREKFLPVVFLARCWLIFLWEAALFTYRTVLCAYVPAAANHSRLSVRISAERAEKVSRSDATT